MIQVSDCISVFKTPSSWAVNPGVISGCEVYVDMGLQVKVKPGKMATVDGYTAEIVRQIINIGRIIPPVSGNRMDYVTADISKHSVYFNIVQGSAVTEPIDHEPLALNKGIILAKLYVTSPCLSPKSIYIYNSVPVVGEGICQNFRALAYPDGTNRKFYFPFKVNTGYSLDVTVFGVGQTEGRDYTVSELLGAGGKTFTAIEFDESPGADAVILANIYLGKTKLEVL